MDYLHWIIIAAAAATVYFTYDEYRKGDKSKKYFIKILAINAAIIIGALLLFFF